MGYTVLILLCAYFVVVAADISYERINKAKRGLSDYAADGSQPTSYQQMGVTQGSFSAPNQPFFHQQSNSQNTQLYTYTKQVPIPYQVTVDTKVPYRVEVPVNRPYPVYVPKPYPVYVEKRIPYEVKVPYPQPYPVDKKVPVPVRVPVDRPYLVPVEKHFPIYIEKKVPVPIEKRVPYPIRVPIERPYPVEVPVVNTVPYPVDKPVPYPIEVPVDKPIPVPVEQPAPFTVGRTVPYTIEKPVPYPVAVPVKEAVQVPYPITVNRFVPIFLKPEEKNRLQQEGGIVVHVHNFPEESFSEMKAATDFHHRTEEPPEETKHQDFVSPSPLTEKEVEASESHIEAKRQITTTATPQNQDPKNSTETIKVI